jgi:nucleotide-binding universal stress UspA family protein
MEADVRSVVLVGVDLGPRGDDAIQMAVELARCLPGALLHVAYVLDPSCIEAARGELLLQAEERLLERSPSMLRRRLERVSSQCYGKPFEGDARTHVRIGKPVEVLCQLAVDYEADFLVVGTQGRRGASRVLQPSVAERLVRVAPCPVLVARPRCYERLAKTPRPDAPYAERELPRSQALVADVDPHISTQIAGWDPSGGQPTGVRIV